jgi:hypothetical protein
MKWNPNVDWLVKLLVQLILIGIGSVGVAYCVMLSKFWYVW